MTKNSTRYRRIEIWKNSRNHKNRCLLEVFWHFTSVKAIFAKNRHFTSVKAILVKIGVKNEGLKIEIFGGQKLDATLRVFGPKSALRGHFSDKSDFFLKSLFS